jgi:spore coat protein A
MRTCAWRWAACFIAGALLLPGALRADQVVLQPLKDNTLYQEGGSLSNGSGSYIFSGRTNNGVLRRALLAFDIAGGVPAGSTITGVTLTLHLSRTKAGNETVRLHRVLADWGEGASNADAQEGAGIAAAPGDATWLYRFYNTALWTAPGGDFSSTASASQTVGGTGGGGLYSWSASGMVADVQAWLSSPTSSFGWILIGNETANQTAKRFDSRENGTLSSRPRLTITYTPPALPGACCVAGACSQLTQTECASRGGTFQGAGTSCSPNPCAAPTGACCAASGSCSVVTSSTCASTGGVYRGDLTTCSPNPCPQPTGACCAPNGTCSLLTQSQCGSQGGAYQGDFTTCAAAQCPVILTPFVDPLPIPGVAQPTSGSSGGAATYEIFIQQFQQKLHRDLPSTIVWGFNGSYPGPTIEASTGQPVRVVWNNDLRDAFGSLRVDHYLAVDTCLAGPDVEGSKPRTVFHLHGGHVPAPVDGYPEATILPGEQAIYDYPNNQLPGTLWYHDHALGITRLNVYMGLAGFYLLRDAFEASLGLPSGEFEIPLAIQDRKFHSDGRLEYPAAWMEHFFGDTLLVNGKVWPYLNVRQGKYRFRLLNGSTSRTYTLSLSRAGMQFQQIGTEGGLLSAPVPRSQITFGPGERADVVVDFAGIPAGAEILLTNSAPAPYPGVAGEGVIPNVMKFVVTSQAGYTAPLPASLRAVGSIPESEAVMQRDFELRKGTNACTGSMWTINDLGWRDITEFPELGTTEVWRFVNRSGFSHPMHMHLVMFQVLDRQLFEVVGGEVVPVGSPAPPAPYEAGWKDTVMVNPNEIVRVIARFEDYTGRFAYHCHILEHEDHEMMRQFQTISCGNSLVEPTEGCDDGNRVSGDACSAACRREEFLRLAGVASGGTVALILDPLHVVVVSTTPGQSAAEVAAALAAAINADPELAPFGITASADGTRLMVNTSILNVSIGDAGLREALEIAITPGLLWWSSVGDRIGYDLVRGDLRALNTSGGDFTAATLECLADNVVPTSLPYTAAPAAGQGWWFLVRKVTGFGPGSYDSGWPTQVGSRDGEIAASPNACP